MKIRANFAAHFSALKPLLTKDNKETRINSCRSLDGDNEIFMAMVDYVHLCDKWFYTKIVRKNYYMLSGDTHLKKLQRVSASLPNLCLWLH